MSAHSQLAVVTGAAHGIGLSISVRLAERGFKVLAIDSDRDELARADLPANVARLGVPISDRDAVVQEVAALEIPLAVLVNNVGIMAEKSFLEISEEEVANSITVNVLDTWRLTRSMVDRMIAQPLPNMSVVFNLSLHVERIRMCPDYSASKAALRMLAQEMAFELGPIGVRVNSVWPGAIDTWSDRISEAAEHRQRSEAMVPLRRLGDPADVASLVAFLCSEDASYITGADIRIDGGLNQFNWLHSIYSSAADERSLYE